ncbi:translational activator of cytochrome c oxidase 1 isoform X1 [Colossoma macropomum]|uniref:translational activator of cytochrome c oxidase 1 isoform X1 n=1 Tax=Colossoma macropomum TaxID=42526 RepID=UPI0018646944|nr:translational activator of cytochrome c oxidase 1 isoform X1 [Colossoma macropomum]
MSTGAALRAFLSGCTRKLTREVPWPGARRLPPFRALHACPPLCAGHNKWSKVKDIKIPKDAARARLIAKYTMLIRVAVKGEPRLSREGELHPFSQISAQRKGGSNPEFNITLAQLIEQCRNKNLPKSTIEAAIKGAEKSKAAAQCLYEARGPGGCWLLIEVLTDNNTRSHNEIKHILTKNGGVLCDGARHNFDRKGVVVADRDGISTERALELAIESGAEDVQETEDEEAKPILQFICDMSSMKVVRTALEALGVHTLSTGMEYISNSPTPLPQPQLEANAVLLEALNDYPDVVRVWDNIQALE